MNDYRGRFLGYELLTNDPRKAKSFYTRVVGWGTEAWPGMAAPYEVWTRSGVPMGGLMELPKEAKAQGAPPHWLAYVGTPDVDGTVAQARRAGGRVYVEPRDIPTVGRFAVLADPGGVTFAVYAPEREPAADAPAALGDCSWHEIVAADPAQTWTFMSGLFGWEKKGEGHDMGPLGIYQEYGRAGAGHPLGGLLKKPADMPASPHIMLYFRVADVARTAEVVKAEGGQVLSGPMDVPGGDVIVNCLDPQGAGFSLHHTTKA